MKWPKASVSGFTLIEVLLAITILAAGALLALPALQRSGDHLRYLYQRADADIALNNLLIGAELRFRTDGHLRDFPTAGEIVGGDTPFAYEIQTKSVNRGASLMEVTATVRWKGEDAMGLSRSAYVTN